MVKSTTVSVQAQNHAASHEAGGADAITMGNLPHATQHESGGGDVPVFFTALNNMTGSRSNSTEYQNTSDIAKFVIVSGFGDPSPEQLEVYVGTATPLGAADRISAGQVTNAYYICASFIVPPGCYYKTEGLETSIPEWWEST